MSKPDKITAAMMSETIREVLSSKSVMKAIIDNSEKKPPYWDMMEEKDGITAIVIAQMLKAMAGDTSAFTALSKYGFGEKVQMDVSDFYRTDSINITVVEPKNFDEDEITEGETCGIDEGTVTEDPAGDEGLAKIGPGE